MQAFDRKVAESVIPNIYVRVIINTLEESGDGNTLGILFFLRTLRRVPLPGKLMLKLGACYYHIHPLFRLHQNLSRP